MGKNSSPASQEEAMISKNILTSMCVVISMTTIFPQPSAKQRATAMPKTAQTFIQDFRRGEDFDHNDSISAIVVNRRVSPLALTLLTKELAVGDSGVRKNLIRLLERIGLEMDTPAPEKFAVIRDKSILGALVVQGFAKDDAASEAAATVLSDRVKPSDLAVFRDIYIASLQQLKGDYLLLASKAKVTQALPFVERIAQLPKWQDDSERQDAIKIAQAALGNALLEEQFITSVRDAEAQAPQAPPNRFYNVGTAKDGTEVANRLGLLGLIGTRRSLLTVCEYLRSPLKSYVPQVSERSVRYAALDALLYNFPDERVLHDPVGLAGWSAAEAFCRTHLGAVFDGPTPNIPPDQAYPTRVIPRPVRK